MKINRKSNYDFDRALFEKSKSRVEIAKIQIKNESALSRPRTVGLKGFWGSLYTWGRGIWEGIKKLFRPSTQTAITLSPQTVPIGFEYAYDHCGRKLKPVHRRKREGGRYYWCFFKCLVCGSTTTHRFVPVK